ncbi:MAG: hypothetical protein HY831_00915 [Candidatus Aenigmarchaeota archaeon]|nr:hypothetical protein [Candidatus Aenigmarchaeota archaeon]
MTGANGRQTIKISSSQIIKGKKYKGVLEFPEISVEYVINFRVPLSEQHATASFYHEGNEYSLSDIGRLYPEYHGRLLNLLTDAAMNLQNARTVKSRRAIIEVTSSYSV